MKTIWCLFSVACDHNQPKHNLECWWSKKPDLNRISETVQFNDIVLNALLTNNYVKVSGCNYYLKEVQEGKMLY